MFSEAVVGAAGGGLLRLAPEIIRVLEGISQRRHEERLQKIELQFAKLLGAPRGFDATTPLPDSTIELMREGYISEQAARANRKYPIIAAITAKRDQIDGAILTGRLSAEQYQFEAGRRAGLSDAIRIIEGQQGQNRRDK